MTIEEIKAENKQRAEVLLGAEYEEIDGEIKCNNVEVARRGYANWTKATEPIFNFDYYEYRLIKKPEMVDLDFEDVPDLINQRVVCVEEITIIDKGEKCFILGYSCEKPLLSIRSEDRYTWITFSQLRQHFTRPDGSKFEKEKK